jgi:hypothetical protein
MEAGDVLLKGIQQTVSRGKTQENTVFEGLVMPMHYKELAQPAGALA